MEKVCSIISIFILCGIPFCDGTKVLAMKQLDSRKQNGLTHSASADLFLETYQKCQIKAVDPYTSTRIKDRTKYGAKMIDYQFHFVNYTINPLVVNNSYIYNAEKWTRINASHGQVLLSLSASYGIMSLMTLTIGVEPMDISLFDSPTGCASRLSEMEKINTMTFLLMRDFQNDAPDMTLKERESICHETIIRDGNYGAFGDRCCYIDVINGDFVCKEQAMNPWLKCLFLAIIVIKFLVMFFGPLFFISSVLSLEANLVPYAVKLKDPLIKTICVCTSDTPITKSYHRVLDLRNRHGFKKLQDSCRHIQLGEPIKVKFTRYDILVNYDNLMTENEVPVGLLKSLSDTFFKCEIKDIGPFQSCCDSKVFDSMCSKSQITWYTIFSSLAAILAVVLAPILYYIRLSVYYLFEEKENINRHATLEHQGLLQTYDGNVLHMLTPTHWLFLTVYGIYFLTACSLGLMSGSKREDRIKRILIASFTDLQNFSWLKTLRLLVANMIWPFTRFGVVGLLIAPIYWIIVLPITVFIYIIYSLPATYIALRLFEHAKYTRNRSIDSLKHYATYRVQEEEDHSMNACETDNIYRKCKSNDASSASSLDSIESQHVYTNKGWQLQRHTIENFLIISLCLMTMYGILLILSECVGFFVEVLALTVMGIVVNAGSLLRYISLFIMLLVYGYSAYSDVGKKYLKTIKCLFSELKNRCKDIEEVTSLPSHLQENFGFKSQELSEQADYELPDDLDPEQAAHWLINDLVLFIDNEDMPRLPKELFDEVCEIRTVGAPGPVYLSLIDATQSLIKIMIFVFFVFIVVATFGSVYQVSSTNQMVATMAGGAIPMFMRKFIDSSKPEIEFDAVSFKNKLEEIIQNFQEVWPIYDLPFEVWTQEDEKKLEDDGLKSKSYYRRASLNPQTLNKDNKQRSQLERLKDEEEDFASEEGLNINHRSVSDSVLDGYDKSQTAVSNEDRGRRFDIDMLIYLPGDEIFDTPWCDKWSDYDEEVFLHHKADTDKPSSIEMKTIRTTGDKTQIA